MTTRLTLLISFVLSVCCVSAQTVSHVYKVNDLLKRINQPDTTYVVNFWAKWCKPCIQELPAFDSLYAITKNSKTKILLVSLDFKEDIAAKVNPFLREKHIKAECVLLDEINGNDFVNKISNNWSGAIPATFFKNSRASELIEKKLDLSKLQSVLSSINSQ